MEAGIALCLCWSEGLLCAGTNNGLVQVSRATGREPMIQGHGEARAPPSKGPRLRRLVASFVSGFLLHLGLPRVKAFANTAGMGHNVVHGDGAAASRRRRLRPCGIATCCHCLCAPMVSRRSNVSARMSERTRSRETAVRAFFRGTCGGEEDKQ